MQDIVPKHIEKALLEERDQFIAELDSKRFNLREIKFILEQPLSTQRINQVIINRRSKKKI